MTDAHDPLDPLDDVASAVLDGTATAEEAARAATDPALAARVDQLRSARDLLREAHASSTAHVVDPARRDQAIAAALAAYEEDAGAAHEALVPALARRRIGPSGSRAWLVGIAAAVAMLALAVPLLGGLSGSDDESSETAADASEDAGASTLESATGFGGEPALPHLGPFDDLEVLASRAATQARDAERASTTGAGAPDADERAPLVATCPQVVDAAYVAEAELGGRAVLVVVARQVETEGTRRVEVIDPAGCTIVGSSEVPSRQP